MLVEKTTRTIDGARFESADFDALVEAGEPCILKGALDHCPLVRTGKESSHAVQAYLVANASKAPLLSYVAEPSVGGRFFYNADMDGMNYTTEFSCLAEFFEQLNTEQTEQTGKAFYIGSAELGNHFPNLLQNNGITLDGHCLQEHSPTIGIWLGNQTTAATHFDVSNNIAACVVGRRRFTLFPPEQIENLYPGPLEPTPGGQVVSMVDWRDPDLERYPRARKALQQGQVADLEAGDVLVYPAMWWHNVEALDDFNVLINYWWNTVPSFVDDPMNTLLHGLLSLRDRPDHEKSAWRALFDYYVFGDSNQPRAHLPERALGHLATLDSTAARRLRAKLLNKFNR